MNNECMLALLDLSFTNFTFDLKERNIDNQYITSFKIDYASREDDDSIYKVTIETNITNKEESFVLKLTASGIFKLNSKLEKNVKQQLVEINTVAIMLPYIRSQVSILTTQPGMQPIILQPINVQTLLNNKQ